MLGSKSLFAQEKWSVNYLPSGKSTPQLADLPVNFSKVDKQGKLKAALEQWVQAMHSAGYISAGIDSIKEDALKTTVYYYVGQQFKIEYLRNGNIDPQILDAVGYKSKFYFKQPFEPGLLSKLQEDLLRYAEDHGYPFATVRLDSFRIVDDRVSGAIFLDLNELIRYDTLDLSGTIKLRKKYLYNYLNIKPGNIYRESDILKITQRVRDLNFVEESQPFEVLFTDDKARISLVLRDRKTSQFDFLVGFLPNSESTGKLILTGDINLNLVNSFGAGEQILFTWKKLQPRTQDLDLGFNYPYLFSLPFGINAAFSLYKRDSLYLDIIYDAGIRYLFAGANFLEAFVDNRQTILLNVDTLSIVITGDLPDNLDITNTIYGVKYYFNKLDYRQNPRSGYLLNFSVGAGTRKIKSNSTIAALDDPENPGNTFAARYDSLGERTIHLRATADIHLFWPLGNRHTILTAFRGGYTYSESLFNNELFRLGGNRMLRGFDEESITASFYALSTFEYRFLLTQNSYVYAFFDGAFLERRVQEEYLKDWPLGFGAGMSFETNAGIFTVSYALGRQLQNSISFRSAKIHFGYVNYF